MRKVVLSVLCGVCFTLSHGQSNSLEKERAVRELLKKTWIKNMHLKVFNRFYLDDIFPVEFSKSFWNQLKTKTKTRVPFYDSVKFFYAKKLFSVGQIYTLLQNSSIERNRRLQLFKEKINTFFDQVYKHIYQDLSDEVILELKKKKLFNRNLTNKNCNKFKLGNFLVYSKREEFPSFLIRKKDYQLEYTRYSKQYSRYSIKWDNCIYYLGFDPKGQNEDFDKKLIKYPSKFTIYHIEENTYSYIIELRGVKAFGRAIKISENAKPEDFLTGWSRKERSSYLEGCFDQAKKLKKENSLVKVDELKEICECSLVKIEREYPIPSMIPKDFKEKVKNIVLDCFYNNKPKF